jgi:hypothetical protein
LFNFKFVELASDMIRSTRIGVLVGVDTTRGCSIDILVTHVRWIEALEALEHRVVGLGIDLAWGKAVSWIGEVTVPTPMTTTGRANTIGQRIHRCADRI